MKTLSFRLSVLLAASLASAATCTLDHDKLVSQFGQWIRVHDKSQASYDYSYRLGVFEANAAIVHEHNSAFEQGLTMYTMSLDGPFADLTAVEFERLFLMTPQNCSATHASSGPLHTNKSLPTSVDWRTKGVVTPVKSQGHCGSCWTFSTTGTLEAHHCIANNMDCTDWSGLAEQQLVDCAGAFNNHGCSGGLPSQAFEYIQYSGGIMTEDSYAYTAKDSKCHSSGKSIGATVNGVYNITSFQEDEIVQAVAHFGPVSVAYQVAGDFRLYSHGVYDSYNATTNETLCQDDAQHVNHAVVAVGYGETMSSTEPIPFYIIRNSWGNTWGMEGHFWMVRGKNMCGVSDCASFPIVLADDSKDPEHFLRTISDLKFV